ncbi:metal-dependent phosphohydrolase, HD subdomain protein [Actinomadura sp. NBRC 104412]|uniref:HD domain-containing protein n=1 Tax=Actinomadura sp. NBRC 104412 TaxID=3032203 RepID=UPI0024A45ADB|nr:HD domain-containing protein [Actinomadura sp. NBRC 104412]GLZ07967.1 metal-dependent phosphohydrolase, HD subdomain protein [Actinomadura sp. NBRC 104412]
MNADAAWACEIARDLLEGPLPRRWAHTQGVAGKARDLAPLLGDQAGLLEAAAWLHDIGYSPDVAVIGFHPLDGARYLRDVAGANEMLCRLVAGHSCAIIEARERGLAEVLSSEFPPADARLSRALTYCDMTTTPDGKPVAISERLAEIRARYGPVHVVTRFTRLAEPHLVGAVEHIQTESRLAGLAL